LVAAPCPEARVSKHGILEVRQEDDRVINFLEKPDPKVIIHFLTKNNF
jgi:NDP-sugar pyrophosphorylase family protein